MERNIGQWINEQKDRLKSNPIVGYATGEPATAEPVAIAGITACSLKMRDSSEQVCRLLEKSQNADGSVSVRLNDEGPFWTTSLACIAWRCFSRRWPDRASPWCNDSYRRGIDFLLHCGVRKLNDMEVLGTTACWLAGPGC